MFTQLIPSADAYMLFSDKSPTLKSGYLGYPLMAGKLTDRQVNAYAKLGIRSVTVVQELNGITDTVSIRKYDNDGFLMERDTFIRNDQHRRSNTKWRYEYALKEKRIKELILWLDEQTNLPYQILAYDNYYDSNNRLARTVHLVNDDTAHITTSYIKADSNGILKSFLQYDRDKKLVFSTLYNQELDEMGRIVTFSEGSVREVYKERYGGGCDQRVSMEPPKPSVVKKEVSGGGFKLVYNNKQQSVQIFSGDQCAMVYYLKKRSQICQHYCCPLTLSKKDISNPDFSTKKTINVFDDKGRIVSSSSTVIYGKNPCSSTGSPSFTNQYTYSETGLLTQIISNIYEQKTIFHYLYEKWK